MTDRRGATRQTPARAYLVRVHDHSGNLLGMGIPEDVSCVGIRLLTSQPYLTGQSLTLAAEPPHPLAGRGFSLLVTRCQALPGGGQYLAGSFVYPLTDAEVQALTS